ncbi:hypothetical protein J6590_058675 [Homalodisca vitripennis]|nr:hypothetical protein J6590_058675 [Homalodisca vitripennis]
MVNLIECVVFLVSVTVDVEGVDFDFQGFYQADTRFTPDNETDHLGIMENLNKNVRRMLAALERQTMAEMNKLALEAITLGQNVLHSAELQFRKYAQPERFTQYMDSKNVERFMEAHRDTRYCLEKIDSIFEKLPGVLM